MSNVCLDGIKKAVGPSMSRAGPLKLLSGEVITDKTKQMERWLEHRADIWYTVDSTISDTTSEVIEPLSVMEELNIRPLFNHLYDLCSCSED